jgi:4-amino-4-deoxy-L-arabinose transferase-like glycosyltransferase
MKITRLSFLSFARSPLFLLFCIFLFAYFLRTYQLQTMPTYLHQDEIMNGYVGRFILQNGKDLYGNRWPLLYFDNFGDFPNVIPMYISGLSTFVFGITRFGIRFPIALIGSLVVFPMYALAKHVFKDTKVSLLCAFFIAICPWHIVLSRATAENVMATTVFLSGLYFLFKGIQTKKISYLIFTAILYFISYFLYPGQRVIVPLSLLPTFFLTTDKKTRKVCVLLCVLFFSMTLLISRTPWGSARFKQTSVFYFNNQVNERAFHYALTADKKFYTSTRIFNNKPVLYLREIIRQYVSYFSPNVLFTNGGHPDRYLVPDQGLFYITFLLIVITAYFVPIDKKTKAINKPFFTYLLWIVAISPVASALTLDEVPNVHRAFLLSATLIFIVGYSSIRLMQTKIRSIPVLYFFAPLLLLEFAFFQHQYFVQAPAAESYARYDVRTVLVQRLLKVEKEYDTIIVPREIFPIYYLFYSHNFDPKLEGEFRKNLYIPQINHMYFIDDNCPTAQSSLPIKGKTLIIDMATCLPNSSYELKDRILHRDATEAYKILEPVVNTLKP